MTALHPCGKGELISPLLGDLVGMPDTMTGAVVNPCYPGETYINFDSTLFAEGALPTELSGTWGIDVVVPPIPEIDYMYRVIYDTTNVKSRWRVVRLPNMGLPEFDDPTPTPPNQYLTTTRGITFASLGYGKARAIGVGHTFELDASATNNQGRVVAAQIEGQWTFQDFSVPQTTVTSADFVTDIGPPQTKAPAVTNVDSISSGAVTKLMVLNVPTDPQTLIAACPSSYQADAKFGAYAVTKFASPLLGYQFKNTGNDFSYKVNEEDVLDVSTNAPATAFGIVTGGYNSEIPIVANLEAFAQGSAYTTDARYAPIGPDSTDGNVIHPWVSMPSDMMTNVVMFRNLALGTASAISSNSVVHVKSRNYFECVPNAQNPATSPFTHSPAQYDYQALDAVITVGKQLSDAYPASANDLGEMIGTIWDGVKEIAEPIAKTIGGMGIPVISGISREIGNSIHSNADALNARMQQLRHLSNNTHVRTLLGR